MLFPDKAEQAYTKSNQTLHEFSSGSIIISIPIAYILLIKNRILSILNENRKRILLLIVTINIFLFMFRYITLNYYIIVE